MKRLAALGLATILSGCTPAEIKAGKDAVAAQLKDPDSALFEDVWRSESAVCGRINGKNSFGGYIGYRDFVVINSSGKAYIEPESELPIGVPPGSVAAIEHAGANFEWIAVSLKHCSGLPR